MSATSNPFHMAASHIEQMRQAALYTDGALTSRTKVLAALLWSISSRCEPCVVHYARKAVELGTPKEELTEMLAVASVMGGCVGETWALKAFTAATSAKESSASHEQPCCAHTGA